MKNLFLVVTIFCCLTACNKAGFPTSKAIPTITNFTPTKDTVGGQVTITGTNFSSAAINNIVKFNGTPAAVISASITQLIVTVPSGVVLSGPISLSISGETTTATSNFTLLSRNELLVLGNWYYANIIRNDTVLLNGSIIYASSYPFSHLDPSLDYLTFMDTGVVYSFQSAWGIGQAGIQYKDTVNYTIINNDIILSYPAGSNNLVYSFTYPAYQDTITIKYLSANNFALLRNHHYKHFTFSSGETKQSIDNLVR